MPRENSKDLVAAARELRRSGRPEEAIELLAAGIGRHPNSRRLRAALGDAYSDVGESHPARDAYAAALAAPDDDFADPRNALFVKDRLACAETALGNIDAAVSLFDELLAECPEEKRFVMNKGVALRWGGRFREMRRLLRDYLRSAARPPWEEDENVAGVAFALCLCEARLGNFDESEALLFALVRKDPLGISNRAKFFRLFHIFARRPEAQERLGERYYDLLRQACGGFVPREISEDAELIRRTWAAARESDFFAAGKSYSLAQAFEFALLCDRYDDAESLALIEGFEDRAIPIIMNKRRFNVKLHHIAWRGVPQADRFEGMAFKLFKNAIVGDDVHTNLFNYRDGQRIIPAAPKEFGRTLHLLGACHVWGIHAADEQTLANHLQRIFNGNGEAVRVVARGGASVLENCYLQFLGQDVRRGDYVVFLPRNRFDTFESDIVTDNCTQFSRAVATACAQIGAVPHVFYIPAILDVERPGEAEASVQEFDRIRYALRSRHDFEKLRAIRLQACRRIAEQGCICRSLEYLANRSPESGGFFRNSFHMNSEGNKVIAEEIHKILVHPSSWTSPRMAGNAAEDYRVRAVRWLKRSAAEMRLTTLEMEQWLREVRNPVFDGRENVGAIVMNCNPFTLGHRYLVEQAAKAVDGLYVFVVQEDKSDFPFVDRIRLARRGVADMGDKVYVAPSGKFIISSFSFGNYFGKTRAIEPGDSTADVVIFGSAIAPALNITHRFVGEEPLCIVTRAYNETLLFHLPPMGVKIHVFSRKECGGSPISASTVRQAMKDGDWERVRTLVPPTTYAYLAGDF
ncbi:MAG: tetratricopeptide repeat protein [Planctomycetota bacterium]|jgi:tetratricopeptide (TPR) repeat protein|nr:tetratricopeptide repeat protein [Planctomycetota bacterium]